MRRDFRTVQTLERLRRGLVQSLAIGREESGVGDLANLFVREIEALADDVQDPTTDELFDALCGVPGAQLGSALEQGEVELAPDHAADADEPPATLAEP